MYCKFHFSLNVVLSCACPDSSTGLLHEAYGITHKPSANPTRRVLYPLIPDVHVTGFHCTMCLCPILGIQTFPHSLIKGIVTPGLVFIVRVHFQWTLGYPAWEINDIHYVLGVC